MHLPGPSTRPQQNQRPQQNNGRALVRVRFVAEESQTSKCVVLGMGAAPAGWLRATRQSAGPLPPPAHSRALFQRKILNKFEQMVQHAQPKSGGGAYMAGVLAWIKQNGRGGGHVALARVVPVGKLRGPGRGGNLRPSRSDLIPASIPEEYDFGVS